jgi:hypothetical protein
MFFDPIQPLVGFNMVHWQGVDKKNVILFKTNRKSNLARLGVLPFFMRFYPVELKIFKMSRPKSVLVVVMNFRSVQKVEQLSQHLTINISKNYNKIPVFVLAH